MSSPQTLIIINPFLIFLILLCAGLLFLGMIHVTKPYRHKRKAKRKAKTQAHFEKQLLD
jgi:predicted membrane protein